MVNGDSKKLQELISIFKSAEERVESVLLETNAESVEDLKIKVDKKLERVNVGLIKDSISWAKTDLPTAYKEGERKIDGSISRRLHIDETAIESSYISLAQNVQHATDHAKNVVNQAIKEAESLHGYGATVGNVKDVIQETLARENGSMIITYNNGARMPLSAYAQMLARTSRIETANTGSFDRCKELGLDLVRCTKVPGCCPYCFKYEDKVYSISGRDTRFPSLYDTALQNGYNIMHPNCRHEFLPWHESFSGGEEELKKIIKESNHFENLDKNDKLFKLYNADQAFKRQLIRESREYDRFKTYYGEDNPYKTLGGFRRAYRSNSEPFQEHKKAIPSVSEQVASSKRDSYIRPMKYKKSFVESSEYRKKVNSSFTSFNKETKSTIVELSREILKENQGKNSETVYGISLNGEKLFKNHSNGLTVDVNPEKLANAQKDSIILLHNHPHGDSFSDLDLRLMASGKIHTIIASSPDGKIFSLRTNCGKMIDEDAILLYTKFINNNFSREDALTRLAKLYNWEYKNG